jgi:hypothetical protein
MKIIYMKNQLLLIVLFITISGYKCSEKTVNNEIIRLGSNRELFVDDYLIERLSGKTELQMQHPTPQDIALETNEPWEGNGTGYVTVFKDSTKYRMYYRGRHISYLNGKDRPTTRNVYCYAESQDGIHWIRPELGLFSYNGSKKNNIILDSGNENFSPFIDTNPECMADAKYKALGVTDWNYHESEEGVYDFETGNQNLKEFYGKKGLYAYKSSDGINWKLMDSVPVVTKGDFDSQNLAFWDELQGEYRAYHRAFRGGVEGNVDLIKSGIGKGRDIMTETSHDFLNWTDPVFLGYSAIVDPGNHNALSVSAKDIAGKEYPSGRVSELYTNQIIPYYRAPHLLIGFPTRYIDRGWTESAKALPEYDYRYTRAKVSRRLGTALTEGMIMSSRDRHNFRIWPEAFLRPGLRNKGSWFYGDMYQNWGIVETSSAIEDAPPELSLYFLERGYRDRGSIIRRYNIRIDGFVSLHAPLVGGEMVTKPITFTGNTLFLNVSTSAAGSVRIEVQDIDGRSLPGFSLADCHEIYGDNLERAVSWKANPDLSTLAGKPVRLRFALRECDVYSFRFHNK